MSRRAVTFDISPVGSVEKRAEILRSAALRRGHFEQKACFVKSSGRNWRSELFEGMGRNNRIELFRLLTAVEKKPRDRAIIEALYGTGARVDELVQLRRRQLVADIDGTGGYVTLYGKHGGRTIRVGRRTWDALQFLAEGKERRRVQLSARANTYVSAIWPPLAVPGQRLSIFANCSSGLVVGYLFGAACSFQLPLVSIFHCDASVHDW